MKYLFFFGCCLFLLNGCTKKATPYSFFVAGHSYGSPAHYEGGLYQPFVDQFSIIGKDTLVKMGFLTGDIVKRSTVENWALVDEDLKALVDLELYLIPGNHDLAGSDLFYERVPKTYSSFAYKKDLFILLDGNIADWNIGGDQLRFLEETLFELEEEIKHVFVFSHQLIYADRFDVLPNSFEGKAEELDFEYTVMPLLEGTGKPTYFFAGDVGAMHNGIAFFHAKHENVTYLASGMGGENGDNYLKVTVKDDETVEIQLVPLDDYDWRGVTTY